MYEQSPKNYPGILQSFGIVGIIVAGMVLAYPVILLKSSIGKETAMLLYYLCAVGLPFWLVYELRKNKTGVTSFNFSLRDPKIIPLIILTTLALLFGVVSPISYMIPMPESIKKLVSEMIDQRGISTFMLMVVAAPVLEELIFRGIILDGLLKKYSASKAIIVSSLLFGLVHLNPWQFVTAMIIGVFLGWIYYETRSLIPSIIIHASANLTGFILRFFIDADTFSGTSLTAMYGGIINFLVITLSSFVVIVISIYLLRKRFLMEKLNDVPEPAGIQDN